MLYALLLCEFDFGLPQDATKNLAHGRDVPAHGFDPFETRDIVTRQGELARSYLRLGDIQYHAQKHSEGLQAYQQMMKIVQQLPKEKQDVFRMVYDDEMDLHSVASALEIPEGTVKSRLYHSRKRIAEQLIEQS